MTDIDYDPLAAWLDEAPWPILAILAVVWVTVMAAAVAVLWFIGPTVYRQTRHLGDDQ